MAWFNYGYTHSILVSYLRRRVQDSNIDLYDDDMSRLQDIAPDDYMSYRRPREYDYPDRERSLMDREPEFPNQYSEPESGLPGDYPFHNFNYGP